MCVVNGAPLQGTAAMGVRMNIMSMCESMEMTNRRMPMLKRLKNVLLRRVLFPNLCQAADQNQIVGRSIYSKPRLPGRAGWDGWCESRPDCSQQCAQEGSWWCSCSCNFGGKVHRFGQCSQPFLVEHFYSPKSWLNTNLFNINLFQLVFNKHRYWMSGEANRSKEVFSKYVDSVLQKCAKIRSLGDLHKNYSSDPTAKKLLIPIHAYKTAEGLNGIFLDLGFHYMLMPKTAK